MFKIEDVIITLAQSSGTLPAQSSGFLRTLDGIAGTK